MFSQIEIEMARDRISRKELAHKTGIRYDTLLYKLKGTVEFTRPEMLKIQSAFSVHVPLEELFATDDDQKTA